VVATPPAFIAAAYSTPGSTNVLALLFLAVLAVLFLLTPAVLDLTLARRSHRGRAGLSRWAERALGEV
jgi:hypothetical protein